MTTPTFETLDLEQLDHVAGGNIFSSIAHVFTSFFGSNAAHQVAQSASQQGPTPPALDQAVNEVDRALGQTDQPYTDPTDIQVDNAPDINHSDGSSAWPDESPQNIDPWD